MQTLQMPRLPGLRFGRSDSEVICDHLENDLSNHALREDLLCQGHHRIHIVIPTTVFDCEINPQLGGFTCPQLASALVNVIPEFKRTGIDPVICLMPCEDTKRARAILAGRAVHEVAHLLTARKMASDEISEADRKNAIPLSQTLGSPPSSWPVYAGQKKWATHEASFIRACLHLHSRMVARGWDIPLQLTGNWHAYGYEDIEAYADLLEREIRIAGNSPIRQILDAPAPGRFLELWTSETSDSE
jgi:hypothetical protein